MGATAAPIVTTELQLDRDVAWVFSINANTRIGIERNDLYDRCDVRLILIVPQPDLHRDRRREGHRSGTDRRIKKEGAARTSSAPYIPRMSVTFPLVRSCLAST